MFINKITIFITTMKYFSMFSGIGGFEYGIKKAYDNITQPKIRKSQKRRNGNAQKRKTLLHTRQQPPSCIGFSEIDKYAIQIYKKHYPSHKNYGDATKINAEQLPDFDLLCGGFPCQSFSIAGKRMGFEDTRGTLFFDIARIIKAKRPQILFLENVKGLLNHDNGRTFLTIIATLDELGYNAEWEVLNSKYFGVPQNRERVFIIGHLRGTSSRQVFPLGKVGEKIKGMEPGKKINRIGGMYEQTTRWGVYDSNGLSPTITKASGCGGGHLPMIKYAQKSDREIARIYDPEGIAPTLHLKTGGWQEPKILDCYNKKVRKEIPTLTDPCHNNIRVQVSNFSPREFGWKDISPAVCARDYKDPKIIRTAQALQTDGFLRQGSSFGTNNPASSRNIRRLTPIECERLQGFPDGWTEGISDTQRYKCLGNAVTVNVIEAITEKIIRTL